MPPKEVAETDIAKIEAHEWHLWYLAFSLILFLAGLTAATYFYLLRDSLQVSSAFSAALNKALAGLCVLTFLFCAYIVQTRITFGRMRGIIQKQSTHDALTHLYNRHYFNLRIEDEIQRADQNGLALALILCDLDRFKEFNDAHGRQAGDRLLRAVARSIQESTRGTDLVFRWGGDEIAVVLSHATREGITIAGERMRHGVQRVAREHRVDLDISIGAVLYPEHGRNADELIRLANRALYIAEKSGDKLQIGDEQYQLDERSIKVVFQPIVDVWADQTMAHEALCRDPQGKLGVAEFFAKYRAIGRLAQLKRLCLQSQLQAAERMKLGRVFINVDFSAIGQLEPIPKPDRVEVILEISEAEVLQDIEECLRVVEIWRKRGYQFAIDDFGAGFISLPFIAQLKPDYIKLDRSTVLHAVASGQFRGFLRKLMPALRMYTAEGIIAEGIETEEELRTVKEFGIFLVQGYLLGRPQELHPPA